MTTMRQTKVAIIREPGHPVGQPAPCYLNCPCGANPSIPAGRTDPDWDFIECPCGRVYDTAGWIQTQEAK